MARRVRVVSRTNLASVIYDCHNTALGRVSYKILTPEPAFRNRWHKPRALVVPRRLWKQNEPSVISWLMEIHPASPTPDDVRTMLDNLADAVAVDRSIELRWDGSATSRYIRTKGADLGRPRDGAGTELNIEQLLEVYGYIPEYLVELPAEPGVYDASNTWVRTWMTV